MHIGNMTIQGPNERLIAASKGFKTTPDDEEGSYIGPHFDERV